MTCSLEHRCLPGLFELRIAASLHIANNLIHAHAWFLGSHSCVVFGERHIAQYVQYLCTAVGLV